MTLTRQISRNPEPALLGIAASAAAAFSLLTAQSLRPKTIWQDLQLRRMIPFYGRRAKKVSFHFGYLAKEYSVLPAAGLIAAKLIRDGKPAAATAVLAATTTGIAASHIFDATLPQKTPPPGRKAPFDPHFPSGHALHSTSLIATAAWVLGREKMADRKTLAAGATALAFAFGVDRLAHDRHWTTDVVGGWLAAIAIASLAAAGYERARRPARAPKRRVGQ